jgi:hypothetical protein
MLSTSVYSKPNLAARVGNSRSSRLPLRRWEYFAAKVIRMRELPPVTHTGEQCPSKVLSYKTSTYTHACTHKSAPHWRSSSCTLPRGCSTRMHGSHAHFNKADSLSYA